MAANFLFIPEKLIEAGKQVLLLHPKPVDFGSCDHTQETKELIERLYSMPDTMNRAQAAALTDKETDLLAGYLPYNYMEVDESRLIEILRYRLNERSCGVLFGQWQESFRNPACNSFLKTLTLAHEGFQNVLKKNHIDGRVFLKVLDSPNIPLSYDEEIIGRHFADGADFDEKLKYYGVVEQSFLDMECKRALLTFCGKADYFSCSEENILDIIGTYDTFMLRKFLLNFMSKMSLAELQVYPGLADYLNRAIGHRRSDTFREFFQDVDPDTVQQYTDWINLYKINTCFDNDERSRFWKQYRYVNVIYYPVGEVVLLEFEQYVAVEFLGAKKGTIYLCEKEIFREVFYDKIETMNNEDLRSYFKIHKEACAEYRNHTGRWQAHMENAISKRKIAEKVRI